MSLFISPSFPSQHICLDSRDQLLGVYSSPQIQSQGSKGVGSLQEGAFFKKSSSRRVFSRSRRFTFSDCPTTAFTVSAASTLPKLRNDSDLENPEDDDLEFDPNDIEAEFTDEYLDSLEEEIEEELKRAASVPQEATEDAKKIKIPTSKGLYKPHKGLPIVAIIGRPNVGKSTIVNRLADANCIVDNAPGITRDRAYREAYWRDREFVIVDTGGLVFDDNSTFMPEIRQQAFAALAEATAAIFVVDGQSGPNAADEELATYLRKQKVPVLLAVNKCESPVEGLTQAAQFWALGLGEPLPVSGLHGTGTGDLLDQLVDLLPPPGSTPIPDLEETAIAIVGRPNVGKSSLLNAFCGSDRAIVSAVSGTTRDSIDTVVMRQGNVYRLIDTAGVRRRTHVAFGPEYFSVNRSFKAIRRADVVLLVIDALDGVTDQDQKLANRIAAEGRACVIVVNKWDAIPEKDSNSIYVYEKKIRAALSQLEWAPLIFTSALTRQRVPKILDHVDYAVTQHRRRVKTGLVNEVIEETVRWHGPTLVKAGQQGRIYFGTQVRTQPPSIVLFVNNQALFDKSYTRYFERQFRKSLGFDGTPIRFFWRRKRRMGDDQAFTVPYAN
mmetsp:Transcript_15002/g.25666  ORF Transcript_15002/g.25666 Transcript_15002/m.25666 type:complete len:609 (-) Transcript_15002:688-2514(-)